MWLSRFFLKSIVRKIVARLLVVLNLSGLFLCGTSENVYGDLYLPRPGESTGFAVEEYNAQRKWDSPYAGVPAAVTYSFVTSTTVMYDETSVGGGSGTISPLTTFMPAGALNEIRSAFEAWSNVANITFTEVTDEGNNYGSAGVADIRIGGHAFDGGFGTLAHAVTASFGTTPYNTIAYAWIDFDIAENWAIDSVDGNTNTIDVFQVAAHEIGHAIGLGHETTVQALMNPNYSESFTGLLADDIAGAQFLYGIAAVPEPSAFLFGGLICGLIAVKKLRKGTAQLAK